jgi:hypothetical protein
MDRTDTHTAITSIIGFADLMQHPSVGELTEKQREYLGDIRQPETVFEAEKLITDYIEPYAHKGEEGQQRRWWCRNDGDDKNQHLIVVGAELEPYNG